MKGVSNIVEQCAVRSYRNEYGTNEKLNDKLNEGWIVAYITPFVINGVVEYIEYILERDKGEKQLKEEQIEI